MSLDGFMMHGIREVVILDRYGHHVHVACNRVYQWSSGALTVYTEGKPWKWIPPHRVFEIVGNENG